MATHSTILAWRIPWTEKPGRLQSMRLQKSQTWQQLWGLVKFFIIFSLHTTLTRKNKIQSIRDDISNAFKKYLLNKISFFENNYLFSTVLGLCCFAWAFSRCGKQGLLFVAVLGLMLWWLLLLQSIGSRCMGSGVVVHGLSCSPAYEIFLDQGLNPCPLYWQVDSYPLRPQGSPLNKIP